MKLYHGTSVKYLKNILEQGIRPRGNEVGNWSKYPSRPDMVYLTVTYAFFFAIHILDVDDALVVEIDSRRLNEELLYPDEDCIVEIMAGNDLDTIAEFQLKVRDNLEEHRHRWAESLKLMGNCAYRGTVPPAAITRYCIFVPEKVPYASQLCSDPIVSVLNYKHCEKKYRDLTAWFFGDRKMLPEPAFDYEDGVRQMVESGHSKSAAKEFLAPMRKAWQLWKAKSPVRTGIRVVTVPRPSAHRPTDPG
jgi:hypothetical protein